MNAKELRSLISGISVGLKKAKELFRESTDARGGCRLLTDGEACRCFLCLADNELAKIDIELSQYERLTS